MKTQMSLEKFQESIAMFASSDNLFLRNKSDYLLFEGIVQMTSMFRLKEAFEKSGLKYKSWHCCRHSRGTFLHGKTCDKQFSMQWLGHASKKVHSKYIHTYEELMREIKAKVMCWDD